MSAGQRGHALAQGIYPDRLGFQVSVSVKGQRTWKRFPPNTPPDAMKAWQEEERAWRRRAAIDDAHQRPARPTRGTLAGDVAHYLQRRTGRAGYKADRSHLKAWTDALGTSPRHKLSQHVCEKQIAAWLNTDSSAKTIRHRVRVLKELWRALEGAHARTPLDGIKLPRVPKTIPVPVDDDVILKVAASLKQGLTIQKRCGPKRTLTTVHCPTPVETYARYLIRALTGQRPSQIGRAEPDHIDRKNRIWWVQAGKGGNPVPFPLTDELDLAFAYFDRVNAWGAFDCNGFADTLRRHGWPDDVRPYRMRHNFAIDHLLAGTDLGDLQGLLGHANPNTTRRYAPVLVSRLKAAVERRPLKLVR